VLDVVRRRAKHLGRIREEAFQFCIYGMWDSGSVGLPERADVAGVCSDRRIIVERASLFRWLASSPICLALPPGRFGRDGLGVYQAFASDSLRRFTRLRASCDLD
jgi:hypothetical protein